MADKSPELELARRQAETWFAQLNQRNVATRDLIAFRLWRRDRANAAAYRALELRLSGPAVGLGDTPAADETSPKGARLPAYLAGPGARGFRALIALALAGAIGAGGLWVESQGRTFRTAVGEQRMIRLEDGSRVTLDTHTSLRVKLRHGARQVELERGQAFFEVAHDSARPFSVRVSGVTVRALGTRFDVRREGDRTRVTLLQGRVQVRRSGALAASWVLTPGEQIELDPRAAKAAVRHVDPETEIAWTRGRLVFRNASLAAATAEVNRYSRSEVVLEAPAVARTLVNGSFASGDSEAFVAAACGLYDLRATRRADGTVVLRPSAGID